MEILITNDDGWGAKGILTLVRRMASLGHITVVAPDSPQSGRGAAISVRRPMYLRMQDTEALDLPSNVDVYTTNGTPADCVKLALNAIFSSDSEVDLLVSGINHGSNAAINGIYSGTMGACMVAAEHGIPAIGFSLCDMDPDADFSIFAPYLTKLTEQLMAEPFPYGRYYNVNAPVGEIEGISYTRQCMGHWEKELDPQLDKDGEPCFILVGSFVNHEPDAEDTDEYALAHHRISICPATIDLTDRR